MELKPATTYDEQLKLLQERHCEIVDPAFCKTVLQHINHYRFTAYFLPFRTADGLMECIEMGQAFTEYLEYTSSTGKCGGFCSQRSSR